MEELIKTIMQSEGLAEAVRKGYVVRVWKSYKDGWGEVVNVRMISDHYATESFFRVKTNRNFVQDRIMYLYESVVNYYNDGFE